MSERPHIERIAEAVNHVAEITDKQAENMGRESLRFTELRDTMGTLVGGTKILRRMKFLNYSIQPGRKHKKRQPYSAKFREKLEAT